MIVLQSRIVREREEKRRNRRQSWYKKSDSLADQFYWEVTLVDEQIDISDRKDGQSLSKLMQQDELSHLTNLTKQLLQHSAEAPPEIDDECLLAIRDLVAEYLDPYPADDGVEEFKDVRDKLKEKSRKVRNLAKNGITEERNKEADEWWLTKNTPF